MTELVDMPWTGTPIEEYTLPDGRTLYVKREDLCCSAPAPCFSKMRGVFAHLDARPQAQVVGVLDTFHSQAGWGVAYVGKRLGRSVVNYWPRYASDPREGLVRIQQKNAATLGATTVAVKAGRSAILYHRAKKHLLETYGREAYMVPNALKLPESVETNAKEAEQTAPRLVELGIETVLLSVSSGTVASGVIRGLCQGGWGGKFILHMGYSRSEESLLNYVGQNVGDHLWNREVVNEGYGYTQLVDLTELAVGFLGKPSPALPFPCHPYYDAKALLWWIRQTDRTERTLLWNIG